MTIPSKILITGACGFLGSNIIRKILFGLKGNSRPIIIGVDDLSSSLADKNLYRNSNHLFTPGNFWEPDWFEKVLKLYQPEVIIHVPQGIAYDPNTGKEFSDWYLPCSHKFETRVIYLLPTLPDQIPLNYFEEHFSEIVDNPKHTFLHYPSVFGPRQENGLIPSVVSAILSKQSLQLPGSSQELQEWLFVEDLVESLIEIMQRPMSKQHYRLATGLELTSAEMMHRIVGLMGGDLNSISYKSHEKVEKEHLNIENYVISSSSTFAANLEKTVSWYVNNQWFFNAGNSNVSNSNKS